MIPQVDALITKLGLDSVDQIIPLQQLCSKLKISRPAYVVLAALTLSVSMIAFGLLDRVLTNGICILYPAYMSVKAIETPGDADDKLWLSYWIVFSITTTVDAGFGYFLGFIPLYYFLKLIFLVSLFHPQTQGATYIYEKFVLPAYNQYSSLIDTTISKYESKVNEKIKQARG